MRAAAPLGGIPPALWRAARNAPARLLAVDYDGTLAPFALDPARALPLPAALRALERIAAARRTEVAVLSGRRADELALLLGELPATLIGEHGWTVRRAGEPPLRHRLPDGIAERLERFASAAERLATPARIERKPTSVVVHTRGLAPAVAAAAERRARQIGEHDAAGLRLRPIAAGVELRAAGHDKGTALAALAGALGPAVLPVVVGDDDTDEDGFRWAAAAGGWGVRVGEPRPTAARATLASPAEVAAFLEAWSERVDGLGAAAAEAMR
jgi:trehalose-phosphatase